MDSQPSTIPQHLWKCCKVQHNEWRRSVAREVESVAEKGPGLYRKVVASSVAVRV